MDAGLAHQDGHSNAGMGLARIQGLVRRGGGIGNKKRIGGRLYFSASGQGSREETGDEKCFHLIFEKTHAKKDNKTEANRQEAKGK